MKLSSVRRNNLIGMFILAASLILSLSADKGPYLPAALGFALGTISVRVLAFFGYDRWLEPNRERFSLD